ncbi:MAG: DUF805 domain-containing protein, partial [Tannerella sp.]|nr:DUF805 domain-containing protein [Tannerella sp.]
MKWHLKCFRQYADFSGRARRKKFWMFVLFNFIALMVFCACSKGKREPEFTATAVASGQIRLPCGLVIGGKECFAVAVEYDLNYADADGYRRYHKSDFLVEGDNPVIQANIGTTVSFERVGNVDPYIFYLVPWQYQDADLRLVFTKFVPGIYSIDMPSIDMSSIDMSRLHDSAPLDIITATSPEETLQTGRTTGIIWITVFLLSLTGAILCHRKHIPTKKEHAGLGCLMVLLELIAIVSGLAVAIGLRAGLLFDERDYAMAWYSRVNLAVKNTLVQNQGVFLPQSKETGDSIFMEDGVVLMTNGDMGSGASDGNMDNMDKGEYTFFKGFTDRLKRKDSAALNLARRFLSDPMDCETIILVSYKSIFSHQYNRYVNGVHVEILSYTRTSADIMFYDLR